MPSIALRRLVGALSLSVALLVPGSAVAKNGPTISSFPAAAAWSLANPGLSPAGANHWDCKPTASHPRPVVLLHGTYANMFNSFASLSPAIRRQGYCVFALDYGKGLLGGVNGTKSVRSSSKELATFVDKVLAATGAAQVDLVGYSQGGLVARSYLRFDGGAAAAPSTADAASAQPPSTTSAAATTNKVHALIGLSTPNHGTDLLGFKTTLEARGLTPVLRLIAGDAAGDLLSGSPALTELNAGGETLPGVRYTMIGTRTDIISRPYTDAFIQLRPADTVPTSASPVTPPAGGATVRNIPLQQGCAIDASDHFSITYSPRATAHVLRALDPAFGGRTPCTLRAPVL
ncbi:MAG: alpha/beta fold hydrolase [Solirubrobacteraceae bacterium]|nr:alpha/beta fold hydrolase [Solirubrobacteraceae bacterium]